MTKIFFVAIVFSLSLLQAHAEETTECVFSDKEVGAYFKEAFPAEDDIITYGSLPVWYENDAGNFIYTTLSFAPKIAIFHGDGRAELKPLPFEGARRVLLDREGNWLFALSDKDRDVLVSKDHGSIPEFPDERVARISSDGRYILRQFVEDETERFVIQDTETLEVLLSGSFPVVSSGDRFMGAFIYSKDDRIYLVFFATERSPRFQIQEIDTTSWTVTATKNVDYFGNDDVRMDSIPVSFDADEAALYVWTARGHFPFRKYYLEKHFLHGQPTKTVRMDKGMKGDLHLLAMDPGACRKNYLRSNF